MNAPLDVELVGLTRALSEQARTLTIADIPGETRTWARHCILDYIACGIAGASDELDRILCAELSEQGGEAKATVFGEDVRLPAASAALINGAASHALDFDDVNLAMPGHPSVVILPALLALAEERGSSGAAVLTAFVAGYELECRLGRVLAPGHYDVLGFHATATIGSFGAAAACANLLGLDYEQLPDGSWNRGYSGGWVEICVWDNVQTIARGQGFLAWPHSREIGFTRFHQPERHYRVPTRFRQHSQSGLPS
jgi:2-methylcitrate dehydratase PrpD